MQSNDPSEVRFVSVTFLKDCNDHGIDHKAGDTKTLPELIAKRMAKAGTVSIGTEAAPKK